MNWYKQIKSDIQNWRVVGNNGCIMVNGRALEEFRDDYTRIDSLLHTMPEFDNPGMHLGEKLHNVVKAIYHDNDQDTEMAVLIVMRTILEISDEKYKQKMKGRRT